MREWAQQSVLTIASTLLNVENDVGLSGLDIAEIQLRVSSNG